MRCKKLLSCFVCLDHWDDLDYPMSSSIYDESISDIWNGDAVKQMKQNGEFFNYKEHLGLTISTDGVAVFKSSLESLWPVYLVVNNLPPKIRMNKENMILCCVWFGPKPAMKCLLEPVVEMLQSLYMIGVSIKVPGGMKTLRAVLLNGVFDLVAKAPIVNMTQFNGKYGCLVCTHPGSTLSRGCRVYLPDIDPPPVARTHEHVLIAAQKAVQSGVSECGIKGNSVLSDVLDLVDGIPIDYMHAVLEGVTRWLLHTWLNSENHQKPYYLGRKVQQIDELLMKQRPPSDFSRPPRSLKRHMKYWKASELRNWLLFYSLPLLLEFLPPIYLHHYALLVCSLHILLQECITANLISTAEVMLQDFGRMLPELYGDKSCTANAHLLCHLVKYVRLWGPLWTHSAFGFESYNGHLQYLFHSRANIIDQLVFNIDIQQTLQLLQPSLIKHESSDVMEHLHIKRKPAYNTRMQKIEDHIYIVGKTIQRNISAEESNLLGITAGTVTIFTRLFNHGVLYDSLSYHKRECKRNDQVCHFIHNDFKFGVIKYFTLAPEPVAVIQAFKPSKDTYLKRVGHPCRTVLEEYKQIDLLSLFVYEIHATDPGPTITIPIKNMKGKAVYLELHNNQFNYILSTPNKYEHH